MCSVRGIDPRRKIASARCHSRSNPLRHDRPSQPRQAIHAGAAFAADRCNSAERQIAAPPTHNRRRYDDKRPQGPWGNLRKGGQGTLGRAPVHGRSDRPRAPTRRLSARAKQRYGAARLPGAGAHIPSETSFAREDTPPMLSDEEKRYGRPHDLFKPQHCIRQANPCRHRGG
jgi:hypothetical protein